MDRNDALQAALQQIAKSHGEGAVMRMGDRASMVVEAVPTGALALDIALGIGGLPRGRVTEIFGPESCIDADTFLQYNVRNPDGARQNTKGGSIERLWHRFHGIPIPGSGNYPRPRSEGSIFTLPCVNEDGRIFHGRVVDVVKSDEKECFKLTTAAGAEIVASADHMFFSDGRYVKLDELEAGDLVAVHNGTPFTKEHAKAPWRPDVTLPPVHPTAQSKNVFDPKTGNTYTYSRLSRSRAVFEAVHMNGMSLEAYRRRFRDRDLTGMAFLHPLDHVHHLDEDCLNDDPDNLVLLSAEDHGRLHSMERHNNLRFVTQADTVASIMSVGMRPTFDVRMESPFNNYVAAGFVTHNSGKTTLSMHVVAEAQRLGGICAFIDAEHALDPIYAKAIGVDVDELLISQPDTGEQALEIADSLIGSGSIDVIVIDSVAALTPRAEIEGEMGDAHVGLQARLMSQALRKITAKLNNTNTIVIFINQLREKIGVMYGSPEVTPGGRALKFYSSVRLDIRRIEAIKDGVEVVGNKTRVKVVKNKVAAPFRQAEFDIVYGQGISREGGVLDIGVEMDIVTKGGAWYSYKGEQLGQGREKAKVFLKENPETMAEISSLIRDTLGMPPEEAATA